MDSLIVRPLLVLFRILESTVRRSAASWLMPESSECAGSESPAPDEQTIGLATGSTILMISGAEHNANLRIIDRVFSRRAVDRWERELVRLFVEAYVDGFRERGEADLVRQLPFPFSMH
jgi:cytochrome P450